MLKRLLRRLRARYVWRIDTWPDPFVGYVDYPRIPELPAEERADPLGLHEDAVATPARGLTDLPCPYCHKPIAARHFSTHTAFCGVQFEGWPHGQKPEDKELDW